MNLWVVGKAISPFIVDLRINGTLQTGAVRKTKLPFSCLVGAVSNCAGSTTVTTGGDESVYLFLDFTINQVSVTWSNICGEHHFRFQLTQPHYKKQLCLIPVQSFSEYELSLGLLGRKNRCRSRHVLRQNYVHSSKLHDPLRHNFQRAVSQVQGY